MSAMRLLFSETALRNYRSLPKLLQKISDKQFSFLLKNFRHPSLRAKKYDEAKDVWQARINRGYRFYFRIYGDCYEIIAITKHLK